MKNDITLDEIIKAVTAVISAVWTIIMLFVKKD